MSSKTLWCAATLGWVGVCSAAYFVESQSVWLWLLVSALALMTIQVHAVLLFAATSWLVGRGGGQGPPHNQRTLAIATAFLAALAILTTAGAAFWRLVNAVLVANA